MQKKNGAKGKSPRRQGVRLGKREQQRLIQLALCIGIFLVVVIGKGSIPKDLLYHIQSDTDFKSVVQLFDESISNGEPLSVMFEKIAEVLLGRTEEGSTTGSKEQQELPETDAVNDMPEVSLNKPTVDSMLAMLSITKDSEKRAQEQERKQTDESTFGSDGTSAVQEGAIAQNTQLPFDDLCIPVQGEVTSGFGDRVHPVSGEVTFHTGVDIAADTDSPIKAFSGGTVEYIGESEVYGLYMQIDHGNGMKTFYCHCNELLVSKGDLVSTGQVVATVGASGNATGPHLHLELKQNGVLLDPIRYVQEETS